MFRNRKKYLNTTCILNYILKKTLMMSNISSTDLLLLSLTNYYSKSQNLHILKDIVESKSKLSLRLIDWYVTNYCKQQNIVYILHQKVNNEYFNVYMNYRSQLKAFKKILFDPFRRRERILFHYETNKCFSTTIGQLNFFRWAIENEIIINLEKHVSEVERDMLSRQKTLKNDKKENIVRASSCCKNSIKNMTTFNGNALLSFK